MTTRELVREVLIGLTAGVVIAGAFMLGLSLIPDERIPLDSGDAVWGIKR